MALARDVFAQTTDGKIGLPARLVYGPSLYFLGGIESWCTSISAVDRPTKPRYVSGSRVHHITKTTEIPINCQRRYILLRTILGQRCAPATSPFVLWIASSVY